MQRDFSQHKLRFIIEIIPIPVAIADTDGNVEFLNKAFIDLFGYHVDDVPTTHDWLMKAYQNEHDREMVLKARHNLNRIFSETGYAILDPLELSVTRKDGSLCTVMAQAILIEGVYLAIFHDISEQKRNEKAREKYQEEIIRERDFSHAVLESLPGIFYMFDEEGRFLRWNENFKKTTGYSDEEIEKISHLDLFPKEDAPYISDRLELCFIKGETDAEADLVTKDGNRIPYYWTGMLSTIGDETCVVGMGIDISRRKQAEKMQALGQLAGGIAHDFNNQLGAILGFAEILSSSIDDKTVKNHALMIAEAASRASDLTRKLLAFARKGKYQIGPVDINQSLAEIVTLLSHSIDKRITVKTDFIAHPTFIQGDAAQIHHALLNLAVNGRDAMVDGGTLSVSTHHETLDKTFCMDVPFDIKPGRYVKIEVRDTGTGIDQSVQHRIYEPFFTTKELGEGSGMGLPAVYGTVKNHKGAITFQSEPGKGSVFYLYFQLIDTPIKSETRAEEPLKAKTENLLILVVDDEEMIRIVTSDILRALGYQVILCNDGREAIECYLEKGETIDLVILDLMMPEIDGFETFARLKKINPDVKVILSSGYSLDGQIQELLDQGALDFIQKPFKVSQLTQSLTRAFTD